MPQICNSVNSVLLIYTNKCNIKCGHCLFDCSPEKKERLGTEKVLSLLDHFSEFKIKHLGIAGGEPLLFMQETLKIVSKAKKQGLKTTLLTNGFWASDKKNADKTALELKNAGLTTIKISSDSFHQKFISQQAVFNAVDSAIKQNLSVFLNFSFLNDYSPVEFVAKHKDYFESNQGLFTFDYQPVIPVGRALEKIPKEKYIFKKKVFKKKCASKEMVIDYNGNPFACCSVFFDSSPVFMLNDSKPDFSEKLIESYVNSPLVFFLRNKGPYFIFQLAEKHRLKKTNKKRLAKKFVSLCDYCQTNLNQYLPEDLNKMLLKEFEKGNY